MKREQMPNATEFWPKWIEKEMPGLALQGNRQLTDDEWLEFAEAYAATLREEIEDLQGMVKDERALRKGQLEEAEAKLATAQQTIEDLLDCASLEGNAKATERALDAEKKLASAERELYGTPDNVVWSKQQWIDNATYWNKAWKEAVFYRDMNAESVERLEKELATAERDAKHIDAMWKRSEDKRIAAERERDALNETVEMLLRYRKAAEAELAREREFREDYASKLASTQVELARVKEALQDAEELIDSASDLRGNAMSEWRRKVAALREGGDLPDYRQKIRDYVLSILDVPIAEGQDEVDFLIASHAALRERNEHDIRWKEVAADAASEVVRMQEALQAAFDYLPDDYYGPDPDGDDRLNALNKKIAAALRPASDKLTPEGK